MRKPLNKFFHFAAYQPAHSITSVQARSYQANPSSYICISIQMLHFHTSCGSSHCTLQAGHEEVQRRAEACRDGTNNFQSSWTKMCNSNDLEQHWELTEQWKRLDWRETTKLELTPNNSSERFDLPGTCVASILAKIQKS